jgi:hypothetical protein
MPRSGISVDSVVKTYNRTEGGIIFFADKLALAKIVINLGMFYDQSGNNWSIRSGCASVNPIHLKIQR